MKLSYILLAPFSCLTSAIPLSNTARDSLDWSPHLAEFYTKVEQHIRETKRSPDFGGLDCNLANVQMPVAPTPLPQPPANSNLVHVAIGRGVQVRQSTPFSLTRLTSQQNYTCDITNATAVPASIGAVANLYNASCIAANFPDILPLLSEFALQLPYPSPAPILSPAQIPQSGVHYFLNASQPVFDLTMLNPDPDLGVTHCKKTANSTAPSTSVIGVNGQGNGAVAWLQLKAQHGTGDVKEVYRLNTAGGSPPKTCQGMPPSFSIQYAAEYFFWG